MRPHRARRSSTCRSTRLHGGRRARRAARRCRIRPRGPARRRRRARARGRRCWRDAERPVIMAGTDLYWGHGEDALRELAEALGIPVFLNGLARGCVPADHELFFSRARSDGAQGRRRRARDRRADGLPARLRRARSARTRRSSWSTVAEPRARRTRARSRPSSTAGCPRRSTRCADGAPAASRHDARWVDATCARPRTRSARPSASELDGRPRAAAPDARLRRARRRCSTATRS